MDFLKLFQGPDCPDCSALVRLLRSRPFRSLFRTIDFIMTILLSILVIETEYTNTLIQVFDPVHHKRWLINSANHDYENGWRLCLREPSEWTYLEKMFLWPFGYMVFFVSSICIRPNCWHLKVSKFETTIYSNTSICISIW